MEHIEMVEKLRERTGVSYEDAKNALEQANWDMLDAIVILEVAGKIEKGANDYSTKRERTREENETRQKQFHSAMSRAGAQIASLIERGNQINVDVNRNGKPCFSIPLTAFVLLLFFAFCVVVPALIIGLFFGYGYRLSGKVPVNNPVNSAMDKASELAENLKSEAQNHQHKK